MLRFQKKESFFAHEMRVDLGHKRIFTFGYDFPRVAHFLLVLRTKTFFGG